MKQSVAKLGRIRIHGCRPSLIDFLKIYMLLVRKEVRLLIMNGSYCPQSRNFAIKKLFLGTQKYVKRVRL